MTLYPIELQYIIWLGSNQVLRKEGKMDGEKEKFSISLTTQILIATVGGLAFGTIVGPWASNLKFIGDIFYV